MPKLIVVGSGIKSLAHITQETVEVIKQADKVLYLVNEDLLKEWLTREAKCTENLESLYFSTNDRAKSYQAITDYIISEYSNHEMLCVVFYGHPSVCADPALNAVKKISEQQGDAIVLPAVSSLDCLFADLLIDPLNGGFFCIEASELVYNKRSLDPLSHIVIYQAANLGQRGLEQSKSIDDLVDYLQRFYPDNQKLCIYEAATLPGLTPKIEWCDLAGLNQKNINTQSSLYIPPISNFS